METQNKPTVTKEWLAKKVQENPERTIGRALAAIYKNQTHVEQNLTATTVRNGIGFSKPDARVGTIGARMFNANGRLHKWVVDVWSQPGKNGLPRICKYADQLQKIAEVKKASLQRTHVPPVSNLNLILL